MVLVHDMASECALQMYEVSLKYSNSYRAEDRRTQGGKQYVSRPFQGGDIITQHAKLTEAFAHMR